MDERLSQFTTQKPGVLQNSLNDGLYSTRSWEEMDQTREQALQDYMAGVTPTPTQPTQPKPHQMPQNVYEDYDNAMSQVNLWDPTTNKTLKTYTDYMKQTSTPIAGYEQMDQTFRQIDKINQAQKDLDEGLITEDQMLWDLYADDILEANGYKTRSVGWWMSRYTNQDYTNPLTNKYITDSILDNAREYHNSIQAKYYAHRKQAQDSSLATLLNKGDLSNEDIKTLFPELTDAIDRIDTSHSYEWWVTTNNITPQDRFYQSETGERYYLHSDGQLYKLSNTEKGQKIMNYKEDQDGNIIELSKNGSTVGDLWGEFKSGAVSAVTMIEKFGAALWGGTVGYLIQGAETGDWNYIKAVTDPMTQVDQWNNDMFSEWTQSGRIDLDGFKWDDAKDWSCLIANMSGMILAGKYLGGAAQGLAKFGANTLGASSNMFVRGLGKGLEFTGNLYARSTGLYKGYTNLSTAKAVELVGWGPTLTHLKTVQTYMLKDFSNNLQQLNQDRIQYLLHNEDADPENWNYWNTLGLAAGNAMFNGAISMVLAGGIDDNQVNRWNQALRPRIHTPNGVTENFLKFCTKHYVAINSMSEVMDNVLTMYTGNMMGWKEDGNIMDMAAKNHSWNLFAQTAVKGFITALPSIKSQMQGRNVAFENAQQIYKAVMDEIDAQAQTPEQKIIAANIKADALDYFNKASGDSVDKVFQTMEYLHNQLTDNPQVSESLVTKTIDKVCNPKTKEAYEELYNIAIANYEKADAHYRKAKADIQSKGLKKALQNLFLNKKANWSARVQGQSSETLNNVAASNMYNYFVTKTLSVNSEQDADYLRSLIETTQDQLEQTRENIFGYNDLVNKHSDKQKAADEAAVSQAKLLGVEDVEAVKNATRYYVLKLETSDRDYFNSSKAAYMLMNNAMDGYFYKVDDNTYGLLGTNSEITNLFNETTLEKTVLAMHALGKYPDQALNLISDTFLGDEQKLQDLTKRDGKTFIGSVLQTAIDQHVITRPQAANILISLKNNANTEAGKQIAKIFETDINVKNVTDDKLSDLEKYTVTYNALMHFKDPHNKRFQAKTIASEIALDPENPVSRQVMEDAVKNGWVQGIERDQYINILKNYKSTELFNAATDGFLKDAVEVIGQAGIVDLPDSDTADVVKILQHIAKGAKDKTIKAKCDELITFGKTLRKFEGVSFKGDTVTINVTSYMTDKVLSYIKEIGNTKPGSETAREQKGSYANTPANTEAKTYLDKMTELVSKDRGMVTLKLSELSNEEMLEYYNIMHDAGMFTDMANTPPKDVKEFKTYLTKYTTDIGSEFAKVNSGTKYDTQILKGETLSKVREASKKAVIDNTIAKFVELHPNNKYVAEYNYYDLMKSNLDIRTLSDTMNGYRAIDSSNGIVINPIAFGSDKKGVPIFIKLPENVKDKNGRVASQAGEKYMAINSQAIAYDVNKDMAIKFSLLNLVDNMYDLPAIDVVIPKNQYTDLVDKGLVNPIDTKGEAFFDTKIMPSEDYYRIVLDKNTKNRMKEYIETNDSINMYKLFPFYSNEEANTSVKFNTPGDVNLPDVKGKGLTTYDNIYNLLNVSFEYDKSGMLKKALWDGFLGAHDTLEYNPYSKNNISLDMDKVIEYIKAHPEDYPMIDTEANNTLSSWYDAYRKGNIVAGVDDEYYALLETYDKLNNSYTDNANNDDSKIWLTESNVLKRMVQDAQDGFKLTDDNLSTYAKEIIKEYHESSYAKDVDTYTAYSNLKLTTDDFVVGNSYGVPEGTYIDTAMSKSLLDFNTGTHYRLTNPDGTLKMDANIAEQQIKSAYDYISTSLNKFVDTNSYVNNAIRDFEDNLRIYVPSDVCKLAAITSAADDKILIEDLDTLIRLEADAYRQYYDDILGMKKGTGESIYKQVNTLYNELLKHTNTPMPTLNKNDKMLQINPFTSTPRENYKGILKGSYGAKAKDLRNYILNSYVRDGEEDRTIGVTPTKLVDAYADMSKKFTDDYMRTATQEDKFKKAALEHYADVAVRDNGDINGNTLIADIDSDLYLTKRINATRNTDTSIRSNIYKDIPTKDIDDNIIDYSATLVDRATGVDYLGSWAKYSFLDEKTGTEFDNAVYDREAKDLDLFNTVLKHEDDLIGKTLISLDKRSVDSVDGLSYKYFRIKDHNDLVQLKTDLMLGLIEKNLYKTDYSSVRDAFNKMSANDLNVFLQKVRRENIPDIARTRYIIERLKDTNINKPASVIFSPQNWKNDSIKNLIADSFDGSTPARFDKDPQVRRIYNATMFGISNDSLDDMHKELKSRAITSLINGLKAKGAKDYNKTEIQYIMNALNNRAFEDKDWAKLRKAYGITEDSGQEDYDNMVINYIIDSSYMPETLSFLFNKRQSLENNYKESLNPNREYYTLSNGEEIKINNLNNFFTEGSKSDLRKIIGFDTETSNIKNLDTGNVADSIKDIFQIAFNIYIKDEDGNLRTETINKFIKHDIDPKKWVELNINKKDKFYKENKSYRDAIDAYTKATDADMITYDEIKDIFSGKLTNKPDLVIAYNGDNFEFRILREQLGDAKTLDAISTVLKSYGDTTTKLNLEDVYKRSISADYGEKHSAEDDTKDMMDLIVNMVNTDTYMEEDRYRLINNIKNLVGNDERFIKAIREANKFINKDETLNEVRKSFNDYQPSLDNIKTLQRAFNYLQNTKDGKALFEILPMLDYLDSRAQFVKRDNGSLDKFADVLAIKMLSTDGDFNKALNKMINTMYESEDTDKGLRQFLDAIVNKDEAFLKKNDINIDLLDNQEVQRYRGEIIRNFSTGINGLKNNPYVLDKKAMEYYEENFRDIGYAVSAQKILIDNKDLPQTTKNNLINMLTNGMISIDENSNIEEARDYIRKTLVYNQTGVEEYAREIQNIIDNNAGTGTFRGIYMMNVGLNPTHNDIVELKVDKDGNIIRDSKTKNYLDDVRPLDIALSEKTLRSKFHITDLKDLIADDGNMYILSITNPADNMSSVLPMRVRLVDSDDDFAGFTPYTEEVLRNRDFDGDHSTTTTMSSDAERQMAIALNKFKQAPFSFMSKFDENLVDKQQMKIDSAINMLGMVDKELINLSKDLDKLVGEYNGKIDETSELEPKRKAIEAKMAERLKTLIKEDPRFGFEYNIIPDDSEAIDKLISKAVKQLSIQERYKNTSDVLRYVGNPALYKEGTNTYANRLGMMARLQLEKSNKGDPVAGTRQKELALFDSDDITINNPQKDLYTPNIYLTKSLDTGFDNTVKSPESYINFLDKVKSYALSEITESNGFSKKSVESYKDYIETQIANAKIEAEDLNTPAERAAMAKQIVLETAWDMDIFIQERAEVNNEINKALTALKDDNTFKNKIKVSLDLDSKLKSLNSSQKKVRTKNITYNPYTDILTQDLLVNRIKGINGDDSAINYGNKLFTDEDRTEIALNNDISNGFNKVNIFMTTGFTPDPDTIGVNPLTKAKSLEVLILDKTTNKYNKVPKQGYFSAGSVIGTDEKGLPIRTNKDLYILKDTENALIANTSDSIAGKKLSSLGMAKGNSINMDIYEDGSKAHRVGDIDLIVDINNAFKNPDKLPIGFDSESYLKNAEYKEYYDSNGQRHGGWIFRDVPANILGDSEHYKASIDASDPSTIRRYELMTIDTASSLLGVGRYGSSVLYMDDNGNMHVNTSELKKNIRDANSKNFDFSYNDVGSNIMLQRTAALLNELTEEEFQGLITKTTGKQSPFTSKEEYLNNLNSDMLKLNSEASYNEQLDMIHYLGKDRYYKMVNSCPYNKQLFGGLITSLLNQEIPDSFTSDFFGNPRSARSKTSSKYDFTNEEKKTIGGKVINETQREAKDSQIQYNLLLHIPADVWFEQVTGYKPKTDSLLRYMLNGQIDPTRHYSNSATQENGYYAIDVNQGVRMPTGLYDNVTASGEKTSFETQGDIRTYRNLNASKWEKGSEGEPILNIRDDDSNSNLFTLIKNSQDSNYPTTGSPFSIRVMHLLALAGDRNKTNLERYAYIKGIDNILVNRMTHQLVNDNDMMYYRGVVNSNEVPIKNAMKTINDNTTGYTLRKDLENEIPTTNLTKKEVNEMKDLYKSISDQQLQAEIQNKKLRKNVDLVNRMLRIPKSEFDNMNLKFTWDTSDNETEWKINHWTRSGIDDKGVDQLAVDIGIKNYKAGATLTAQEYSKPLDKLKAYVSRIGDDGFEDFCKYEFLTAAEDSKNQQQIETARKVLGVETTGEIKQAHDTFVEKYPEIVEAYNEHIETLLDLSHRAGLVTNEPFTRNYIFMMPFLPAQKEARENAVYSTLKHMSGLSKYDPTTHNNILKQNMMFNFFEGSEKIINDLSNIYNSQHMSDALLGKYTGKAIIDNKDIINEAYKIIDESDIIDSMKPYTTFDSEITQKVLDIVTLYTDIDLKNLRKYSKNSQELLKNAFNKVKDDATYYKGLLYQPDENGVVEDVTLSDVYRKARGDLSKNYDVETISNYDKLYNHMYAEILIAQRIIESDKNASSKLNGVIDNLYQSGKVLVDKFGRKIERNKEVAPLDTTSFGYLKDNVEVMYNSQSKDMFNQFLLEKALSGELYVADKKLADALEQQVYTAKVPNRIKKALMKVSKFAAGIQMAMPAKMLGRLLRFTGTDYSMGIVSNPEVAGNIPRAAKELSAFLMSGGKASSDDLRDYFAREGQPNVWGSGVDPLEPTISLNGLTAKLTQPLDFQNHLGRYAIYLTAKESFDNGTPWYGSQYYNHKAIDAINDNRDKAMYVMDYMLGSPGGFPELSKHTSGYLMYATFPMNFARTLGSYGMSLGKLFQEGVTAENSVQWYNNVVTPSLGMVGLAALSNVMITAVCDAYGIDEEKEEEWKKEGVTLDPLGTLIGGTPSVVYDSTNPAFLAKEMFINPFTNEYNNTIAKKGYGWMKANVLSSLNPAIKTPIELITGKDLWGDTAEGYKTSEGLFEDNKSYQYTNIENGMRKVFGILVGSGIANNVVDQLKIDSNDSNTSLSNSLWKGISKGFAADLGNQKSWKKNTSNYYTILTDMKQYAKTAKNTYGNTYGNTHYYSIEDMADADILEAERKYNGRYGVFDKSDYNRVSSTLKKMIQNHTQDTTVYNYIVKEFNENNVSEATMRAALNANSIVRKLQQDSMSGYKDSLNETDLGRLQQAIAYENEYYPMLQLLFPDKTKTNSYVPSYKNIYNGGSGSSNYPTYSRPYIPNTYIPKKYYPSTYKFNKKTGKYGPNLKRVQVHVSPQMAIWNQDKNLTQYQTGLSKANDPQWLRSRDYVSRVYQI